MGVDAEIERQCGRMRTLLAAYDVNVLLAPLMNAKYQGDISGSCLRHAPMWNR